MSQQEPSDPSLMKWPSQAELVLHTFIIYTSTALLWNKPTPKPGWGFQPGPHFPPIVLYFVCWSHAGAGECHSVWHRNPNEKQPTAISMGDISSSAVTTHSGAASSPQRGWGFPLWCSLPCLPTWNKALNMCPVLQIGRGCTAWPQIPSCKNLKKREKEKKTHRISSRQPPRHIGCAGGGL